MKTTSNQQLYPDLNSKLTEHIFGDHWDVSAVAHIIRNKSESGKSPAFLYLGAKEAGLLRKHLASAFGDESITTFHDSYYMGLRIVIVDTQQHISTGGCKKTLTVQAADLRYAS